MEAGDLMFTEEEMTIDEGLGYPKAYYKLCRDRSFGPYSHGPPFTFTPFAMSQHESSRAKELNKMFPVIDPKAKPTAKPKIFVSLLWKQLNHLGNAGFDPATFRVDPYGNVLYYYADPASPLAWDVDHWFPCTRGGLTVPSNLRILQWQVCQKKHNKLEFLIPWWDLQVGISINQFLSIFASSNSDFRRRAFSLFFLEGECEELNDSQTVDSHLFPQHYIESKEQVGLAPAAVVLSRKEYFDTSSTLKSLDINRLPRSNSPIIAARKLKQGISKENEYPDMVTNPYQAIVMARNSLRQREETANMQGEIQRLDDEVNELRQRTDEEKVAIQDLELVLIKRRRRAEKCRRLAEAQSSYRAMLEKMIRDAMHQSVIYKEQIRLNQAASNALMARLEAQKAICDSSERELHRKFKQRDELETQIRPEWEHARKRSRVDYDFLSEKEDKTVLYLPGNKPRMHQQKEIDGTLLEENDVKTVLCLPGIQSETPPLHKELRVFLEEEQKASEAGLSLKDEEEQEEIEGEIEIVRNATRGGKPEECEEVIVATEDENSIEHKVQKLKIQDGEKTYKMQFPVIRKPEGDEDEESRNQRGKGNVEKWLQILLEENAQESTDQTTQICDENSSKTDEIIKQLNIKYPQKEIKILRFPESSDSERVKQNHEVNNQQTTAHEKDGRKLEEILDRVEVTARDGKKREEAIVEVEVKKTLLQNPPYRLISERSNGNEASCGGGKVVGSSTSFDRKEKKGHGLKRSESFRGFLRSPSSPSIILGMRKGVDCIGKKPLVIGDEEDPEASNSFIKSSIKSIKKAVKI